VRYYDLPSNPCRAAGSMGKKDADNMEIWTLDDFNKFITFVSKPAAHLALEILFWTGIRSGELLALTPADILPDKRIDICKSLARLDGKDFISEPKTAKSNRIIPIPDFLYDEIHNYINRVGGMEKTDKIFYFSKGFLNKEIKRLSAKAGVKEIRVHDLRHSHASLLIEMGYNILLISERLGHEKVETTLNTYGHLYPNKHKQLADDLQDLR